MCSGSSRSFCKRGHNGLFKILGGGGHHVVWACEAQIPRRAHRIQEEANAPPPPLNETVHVYTDKVSGVYILYLYTLHSQ